MAAPLPSGRKKWSIQDIRNLGQRVFQKRPCHAQVLITQAIREGKDVIGVAPTGFGKTLTFWLPILMALEDGEDKFIIVVTPLNLLGKQNEDQLALAGYPCKAVDSDNSTPETYKAILEGQYRVVTISPELVNDAKCQKLLDTPSLASRLLYVVVDEAHCVSKWGHSFREDYLSLGQIRNILPSVPIYAASATLPEPVLRDVSEILRLDPKNTAKILLSNDRPNIHLCVREIKDSVASFTELNYLIPDGIQVGDPPPPKFLVFCNTVKETEKATKKLRQRLPPELQGKIKYFHATMTSSYRDEEFDAFRKGDVWGMIVTDAFGMGLDLPDVVHVVQWRCPSDMCTLWQRFGRAGRDYHTSATAVLFVDKADLDTARAKKIAKAAAAELKEVNSVLQPVNGKRKATDTEGAPNKRRKANSGVVIPPTFDLHLAGPTFIGPITQQSIRQRRRSVYHTPRPITATKRKRSRIDLGTPLDDFINADNVQRGLGCRREPIAVEFGNDLVDNDYHLKCDPSKPEGCERCRPRFATICCDLCSPHEFLHITTTKSKPAPTTSRARLTKRSEVTPKDRELKDRLLSIRESAAIEVLGSAVVEDLGPGVFLSDEIVQRIVDCAHAGKIRNLDQLRIETKWEKDNLARFGQQLLDCVCEAYPILDSEEREAPVLPVQRPVDANGKRLVRCGACGNFGHTQRARVCPKKASSTLPIIGTPSIVASPSIIVSPSVVASPSTVGTPASKENIPLTPQYSSGFYAMPQITATRPRVMPTPLNHHTSDSGSSSSPLTPTPTSLRAANFMFRSLYPTSSPADNPAAWRSISRLPFVRPSSPTPTPSPSTSSALPTTPYSFRPSNSNTSTNESFHAHNTHVDNVDNDNLRT